MAEATTSPRRVPVTTGTATPAATGKTITQGLSSVTDSVFEMASAQCEIWSMKSMRLAALAAFGVVGGILMIALVMYGFTLLDASLALGLANTTLPAWASPLIRGGIYCGIPLIGMLVAWHAFVGWGNPEKDEAEAKREMGAGV